jgi:hypothetical protein
MNVNVSVGFGARYPFEDSCIKSEREIAIFISAGGICRNKMTTWCLFARISPPKKERQSPKVD